MESGITAAQNLALQTGIIDSRNRQLMQTVSTLYRILSACPALEEEQYSTL
jgi:hypothetical protein